MCPEQEKRRFQRAQALGTRHLDAAKPALVGGGGLVFGKEKEIKAAKYNE